MKAIFTVESKSQNREGLNVVLHPADREDANEGFFDGRPRGQLLLRNVQPDVANSFIVGSDYLVTFGPAPEREIEATEK